MPFQREPHSDPNHTCFDKAAAPWIQTDLHQTQAVPGASKTQIMSKASVMNSVKQMHHVANSFKIAVSDDILSDLHRRLTHTRWSMHPDGVHWKAGTSPEYLRELVDYWKKSYDWRYHEAQLNKFAHFKADVDGIGVHFVHERGKGPNPMPII